MDAFLELPTPSRPIGGTRVGAVYTVPVAALTAERLAEVKTRLTLRAKSGFGAPPPVFEAFECHEGVLCVPRFYGLAAFGPAEVDERVDGQAARCLTFAGTLTPIQERAMQAVRSGVLAAVDSPLAAGVDAAAASAPPLGGGVVSLPCGMGKTVFAVALACSLGRRTAVLVHKAVLRDQWRESFGRFCSGVRVGVVQGKECEVEDVDVVVCMVMTLAKREARPEVFDGVGLVVVDEAHHMAAPVMRRAMGWFRARTVLGLTATRERPDGLTPLLDWSLGPVAFHADRDRTCEPVRVTVALFRGGTREILAKDGTPLSAPMITNLAKNGRRNAFLADRIASFRGEGRVIMVLSDRIAQLETLRSLVIARGVPEEEVGVFKGGQKDSYRVAQLSKPVVMCSYGMANEGVDKKEADTCVMATPKGRVTQCIGRVQRPCATKQAPLVLDVVDEDVPLFQSLRWTRMRTYRQNGYAVDVVAAA